MTTLFIRLYALLLLLLTHKSTHKRTQCSSATFRSDLLWSMFNLLKREEKLWLQEIRWHTNSLQLNKLSSEGLSSGHTKYFSCFPISMRLCLQWTIRLNRYAQWMCVCVRVYAGFQCADSQHIGKQTRSDKQILNRTTIRRNKNLYIISSKLLWLEHDGALTCLPSTSMQKHSYTLSARSPRSRCWHSTILFYSLFRIQFHYAPIHLDYIRFFVRHSL